MPELPEVETMCRGIAPAVGCRISDLQRPNSKLRSIQITPRIDRFRRRVAGRRIADVLRVGKRVVLQLAPESNEESYVVLEPRMTGLVMLDNPPNRKHLRLIMQLEGGEIEHILFWDQRGLAVAKLLNRAEFLRDLGPDRLGPDALEITPAVLHRRLADSRRAVKVALLDQKAVAGLGNIYVSEILHRVGIHPAIECHRLGRADWAKIQTAMRRILRAAIRHQGSTLRDGTYRINREESGGYQRYHRVYQRKGEACLSCGRGRIERIVQAQRSTFFCPVCQVLDQQAMRFEL